jgi:hypothetical protein
VRSPQEGTVGIVRSLVRDGPGSIQLLLCNACRDLLSTSMDGQYLITSALELRSFHSVDRACLYGLQRPNPSSLALECSSPRSVSESDIYSHSPPDVVHIQHSSHATMSGSGVG